MLGLRCTLARGRGMRDVFVGDGVWVGERGGIFVFVLDLTFSRTGSVRGGDLGFLNDLEGVEGAWIGLALGLVWFEGTTEPGAGAALCGVTARVLSFFARWVRAFSSSSDEGSGEEELPLVPPRYEGARFRGSWRLGGGSQNESLLR
jgi:hypothetical protein